MDNQTGQDPDNPRTKMEERIKNVLNPNEHLVMRFQSLLVWECPRQSALLFFMVHGLFWFLTMTSFRFYFLLNSTLIVIFFSRTWKRKIWPEIRVPPKEPEDTDGWTPVHPRLLSVPEISTHLASIWVTLDSCAKKWMTLRRNRPLQFCVVTSTIFILLAMLGHYIPGIMLSYILVMSILLWPCVLYHNILQKCYLKFEPIFMKLDYSMKTKAKWTYQDESQPTTYQSEDTNGETSSVVADNESDLEDFYPSMNPAVTAALAHAITDSEDEGGTPSSFTPHLSKEPSVNNSEDEHSLEPEVDFSSGLNLMPSFDDVIDKSDDEILEPDFKETRGGSQEPIKFVSSHFEDSSGSEEETLSGDLKFPDVSQALDEDDAPSQNMQEQLLQTYQTEMAKNLVAHTLSSMVGSAFSSLSNLAQASSESGASQSKKPAARVTYSPDSDSDDEVTIKSVSSQKQRKPSADSGEINIEDEFEFLDDYDLEDDGEEDTKSKS